MDMNRTGKQMKRLRLNFLVGQRIPDRIDIAAARTPAVGSRAHNQNTAETKQQKAIAT
jgi:hypothetical protein